MMDAAIEALRKKRFGEALDLLLAEWRRTRSPALAGVIEKVAPLVSPPLPPSKEKRRQDHREWMTAARAGDATKVAALLETLSVGTVTEVAERLDVVDGWPADPRVADTLVRFLEAPPFPGEKAKAILWPKVLAKIVALGDRRNVDRLRAAGGKLSQKYGDTFAAWLAKEAVACADRLERTPKPAEVDVTALDAALPKSEREQKERDGDALLANVIANPRDDGARLVYADHLTELGDPRGEFIVLQVEAAEHRASVKQVRLADEILEEHYAGWIGELAPLLPLRPAAWSRFEKGFLAAIDLGSRQGEAWLWEKAIGHPLFATVREVRIGPYPDERIGRVIAAMPMLEVVHVQSAAGLAAAARAPSLAASMLVLEIAPTLPQHAEIVAGAAFRSIRKLELLFPEVDDYVSEDEPDAPVDLLETTHSAVAKAFLGGPLPSRLRSVEIVIEGRDAARAFAEWLDPRLRPACEVKVSAGSSGGTLHGEKLVLEGPAALPVLERCGGAGLVSLKVSASGLRPSIKKQIEALVAKLGVPETVVT